jgi:imidazolonepropionase
MNQLIIKNIGHLVGAYKENPGFLKGERQSNFSCITNAWVHIVEDEIRAFGKMNEDEIPKVKAEIINAAGRIVLPTFADSHTHLVFPKYRDNEFEMKIAGKTYQEIATAGGGIKGSAKRTAELDEEEMFNFAKIQLKKALQTGVGALEIKSGYGLTHENELKILRVIKRLKHEANIPIKATFLGLHAFPEGIEKADYIEVMLNKTLPEVANNKLADFVDVFCEEGYFSLEDTIQLIEKGKEYKLPAKIHVNQFNSLGAISEATKRGVLSVDHLETLSEEEILDLVKSETIPTFLPGCSFYLNLPYGNAKRILKEGGGFALASDFNPGSAPNVNNMFTLSLACTQMKVTPLAAIAALTQNGACAMQLDNEVGTITPGKRANILISKPANSVAYLPYSFGENWIEKIIINGEVQQ